MSMEINSTNSGVTSQIMDLKTSTPGVTRKEEIKTGFKNTNDYSKYLQEKYSYMNTGKTSMQQILSARIFRIRLLMLRNSCRSFLPTRT